MFLKGRSKYIENADLHASRDMHDYCVKPIQNISLSLQGIE